MRRRTEEHKKKRDARDGQANPHLKSPTSHPLGQPYGIIGSQSPMSSFGGPIGVNTYEANVPITVLIEVNSRDHNDTGARFQIAVDRIPGAIATEIARRPGVASAKFVQYG
jgi:hypothetical protein